MPEQNAGNYNKAIVALIMAILMILEDWFGWSLGIDEQFVITVLAVITPIVVWLVPNRPWA